MMAEDDEPDTKRARLDEEGAAAPELEPEAGYPCVSLLLRLFACAGAHFRSLQSST